MTPMDRNGAVAEASRVTVRFGDDTVVDDVSFRIPDGDFVGIMGPNGAGKTTLVRAMLGLVPLAGGEVRLLGQDLAGFREWPSIGYVPQHTPQLDLRVFPATALEVVLLGRAAKRGLFRPLRGEDRRKAREALAMVGMRDQASRRLGQLSGGQRQRVLLAKALAAEPRILVLDEPTAGVDPAARQAFYELLDHLNHDDGITVLLVSHDTQAVLATAHRVLAINRRLVFDGTPEQLRAQRGLDTLYGQPLTHEHDHGRD